MMLVEARIFCGDYSVLEIGRDLHKRNELVPLLIRRVVNPGLQSTLDVDCGRRWVYPPGNNKEQGGNRPDKERASDKRSNQGSQETLPKLGLGACRWLCDHISE
jgi:hypothetical protein